MAYEFSGMISAWLGVANYRRYAFTAARKSPQSPDYIDLASAFRNSANWVKSDSFFSAARWFPTSRTVRSTRNCLDRPQGRIERRRRREWRWRRSDCRRYECQAAAQRRCSRRRSLLSSSRSWLALRRRRAAVAAWRQAQGLLPAAKSLCRRYPAP